MLGTDCDGGGARFSRVERRLTAFVKASGLMKVGFNVCPRAGNWPVIGSVKGGNQLTLGGRACL